MAVTSGDLTIGTAAVLRRESRSVVAYLSGVGLIALGVLLHDHLPYRGATLVSVGGAVILAAIFLPLVTDTINNHRSPPIILPSAASADPELTAIVHSRIAELEEQLAGYKRRNEAFMNVLSGVADQVGQAAALLREGP